MVGASSVSEEIIDYLPHLTDEQQAAVLHVVKAFVEMPIQGGPDEAEILRRLERLKSGEDKGFTWEEVKERARKQAFGKHD